VQHCTELTAQLQHAHTVSIAHMNVSVADVTASSVTGMNVTRMNVTSKMASSAVLPVRSLAQCRMA
jgi:hypothetical protein